MWSYDKVYNKVSNYMSIPKSDKSVILHIGIDLFAHLYKNTLRSLSIMQGESSATVHCSYRINRKCEHYSPDKLVPKTYCTYSK